MEHWQNKSLENLKEYLEDFGWVTERWKDIKGYEGYYAVSTFGRVKSYTRMVWQPQKSRYAKRRERILSQVIGNRGYCKVVLFLDKKREDTVAHILVARAFIKNEENKPQVNHKRGNKKDNRLDSLEWNTAKENSIHAISIGIDSVVGEHNGRCILTEGQVREIRDFYVKRKWNGMDKVFAEKFNVTASTIRKVAYRSLWKHLK